MSREANLTGIVTPELDEQQLDREASRMEDELGRATELAPDLDLSTARKQLENLIPGGKLAGQAISRLRGGGGRPDTGGKQSGGGSGGGRSVQAAQLKTLRDIHEELEKIGASGAGSGDGGGGGGLGGIGGAGLLTGALTSIGTSLGIVGAGGAAGGFIGEALRQPLEDAFPDSFQDQEDMIAGTSYGMGDPEPVVDPSEWEMPDWELPEFEAPEWLPSLTEFEWPELPDIPELSDLEWPEMPEVPDSIADLKEFEWPDFPSLPDGLDTIEDDLTGFEWPEPPQSVQELFNRQETEDSGESEPTSGERARQEFNRYRRPDGTDGTRHNEFVAEVNNEFIIDFEGLKREFERQFDETADEVYTRVLDDVSRATGIDLGV